MSCLKQLQQVCVALMAMQSLQLAAGADVNGSIVGVQTQFNLRGPNASFEQVSSMPPQQDSGNAGINGTMVLTPGDEQGTNTTSMPKLLPSPSEGGGPAVLTEAPTPAPTPAPDESSPWDEAEKGGAVDWAAAARSLGPLIDGITTFTGKVQIGKEAQKVIDGVAPIADGLGTLLMAVSGGAAASGVGLVAAPFLFGAGAVLIGASAILSNLFEGPKAPTLADAMKAEFGKLGMKLDVLEIRLGVLNSYARTSLKLIKELTDIALKNLFQDEDEYVFLAASAYEDMLGLYQHSNVSLLDGLASDTRTRTLDEGLSGFRFHIRSSLPLAKQHRGLGTAALRLHRQMSARLEAHMVLWNYRMLRGDTADYWLLDVLQDNLAKDLEHFNETMDALRLAPWMGLSLDGASSAFWKRVGENLTRGVCRGHRHDWTSPPSPQARPWLRTSDGGYTYVRSLASCQQLCDDIPGCSMISYGYRWKKFVCFLYKGVYCRQRGAGRYRSFRSYVKVIPGVGGGSLQPYLRATRYPEWTAIRLEVDKDHKHVCHRRVFTFTETKQALLVTAVSWVPLLADMMLRCPYSCHTAAKALHDIGFPAAREAEPQLRKVTPDNCYVLVEGRSGWRASYYIGDWNLRAYTSRGALNDDARRLKVYGSGCSVTVYQRQFNIYNSLEFHHDSGWQDIALRRKDVSSLRVERRQGSCQYQARMALHRIGRGDRPPWPRAPAMPPVKTRCWCKYNCHGSWWKERDADATIPAHRNWDCSPNPWKHFHARICNFWGVATVWDCKWLS